MTVRAVRLFGAERIAARWRQTPTLHIDATVDMALLRCRVPHAELVGEVEAAAPHMRVVQYPDRAFGKYALRKPSGCCSRSGIGRRLCLAARRRMGRRSCRKKPRSRSLPRARCRASSSCTISARCAGSTS